MTATERGPGPGAGAAPDPRPRIALVDDEPDVLETAKAVLEDAFEVLAFTEPAQALQMLVSTPCDVLCTDFLMPEIDGLELIHRARRLQPHLGLVLMTGREQSYYRTVARLDAGERRELPYHVLVKPAAPEDLINAILRAASFSRVRRALGAIGKGAER